MAIDMKAENLVLRLWFLMHRDTGLFRRCEDQAFGENGLTMEQFTVLAAMKHIGHPVGPKDIADWIGRTPNTISMIVDRMVKAGLVRRTRDRRDRRMVRVIATDKADDAFGRAIPAGWDFIHKIVSPLSQADRQTLARLLEVMRHEALDYLYPGENIGEMAANDDRNHIKMMERLFHGVVPATPQAKHQAAKKRKTIRRG